ncbi:MAG: acetylornithine/succinylornithine family transaminase [Coriobacteriia bacterium]|nr:acetylornithine/succinylornithine family transaminase [Coriobacteriia bacterium]
MGAAYERTAALDASFHMPTYARKPVLFASGHGMRLTGDDGREYLDFVAAIGSVNLGHAHPRVAEAVCRQMTRLVQTSNLYHVEHRSELAEALVALFGGGAKVFFANSGAEANEGAIKLARAWGRVRGGPECHRIVTIERSFHGRTLATLAATGQPSKQELFEPLPAGFSHVPLNDLAALAEAVDERTCAVMLEPILGESGVWPGEPGYLEGVAALCEERGALLMLDEVQTGIYRTGPAFAHQALGVRPHVMTLAKSLANGLPVGALVAIDEVAVTFGPGDHGSTFGGGPVVCAAALAALAAHAEERTGENAVRAGEHLRAGLRGLAARNGRVAEVRGAGLMNAVTLAEPVAQRVAAAALDRGFVLNAIGDSILRFLPPLTCDTPEIDTLLAALDELLTEVPS